MKRNLTSVMLLSASLPMLSTCVHAQAYYSDPILSHPISKNLNTASMDDYLIDLAREGGVNMIADVSAFPAKSPVKRYPGSPEAIAAQTVVVLDACQE